MSSILSCACISALLTYFEKICVPFATKNFLLTSSCYFNCSARLYYSLRSKWKLNWWSYDFQENLATCQIFNLWLVLQTSQRQSKYPNFSLLYVVLKRLCIEITSLFSLFCDVLKYSAYISSQLKKKTYYPVVKLDVLPNFLVNSSICLLQYITLRHQHRKLHKYIY